MNKMDDKLITSAMRSHLSGLHLSAQGQQALRRRIQGGEQVKKRIPAALVLALVLILATLTALAVTSMIERHTKEVLELGDGYSLLRWNLDDKIAFIGAMERAELPMDQEELSALRKAGTPAAEKERLADSLIDARYGEMLRKYREEVGVEEFDLPKAPTAELVFKEAYLREHPGATDEEAWAAFDAFLMDYYQAKPATEESLAQEQADRASRIATEEDIRLMMTGNLTETGVGLDGWEASKAAISVSFDEHRQAWVGTATIHEEDIDAGRRKWILENLEYGSVLAKNVRFKDGVFTITYLFDQSGQTMWGAGSFEEVEYLALIPEDTWARLPDESLQWRARFSQAYRDKVRRWLSFHPDFDPEKTESPSTEWMTRHRYGLPGDKDIPQEEALRITKERFLASSPLVTEKGIEEYCNPRFYFRITDPEKPMWKVIIKLDRVHYETNSMPFETMQAYDLFIADIDARTGEVLKTYDDYQDKTADFAEMFM